MASKGPKGNPRTRAAKPVAGAAAPEHDAKQAHLAEGAAIFAEPFAADEPAPAPAELIEQLESVPAQAAAPEPVADAPAPAEPPEAAVPEEVVEAAADTIATVAEAAPAITENSEEVRMMTTEAATAATDKAQTLFADMNERTRAAMEKSAKGMEELTDMAKGNVEAMMEASRIAARGFETLGQDAADFGRRQFEQTTQAMKTLAGAKSPTDFFKLQGDYMRTAFDSFVAESSKNTEAMLKLAGDAAQPLSNRVAVAADKFKVAA